MGCCCLSAGMLLVEAGERGEVVGVWACTIFEARGRLSLLSVGGWRGGMRFLAFRWAALPAAEARRGLGGGSGVELVPGMMPSRKSSSASTSARKALR